VTRSLYSPADSVPRWHKAAQAGHARAQRYARRSQVSDAQQWKLVLRKLHSHTNSENRLSVETDAQDASVRGFATELGPHWMLYLLAALFLLRFLYVAHA
jgi:hypothetical protein